MSRALDRILKIGVVFVGMRLVYRRSGHVFIGMVSALSRALFLCVFRCGRRRSCGTVVHSKHREGIVKRCMHGVYGFHTSVN